jgi:hypothetical protein
LKRAAFVVLATGCVAHMAVQRWVDAPAPSGEKRESLVPRRDECLLAPFTLAHDEPKVAHGLLLQPRGDGFARELYVVTPKGAPFDPDGLIAFRDRNQKALRAIEGIESSGLSGCPTREGPQPCIHLDVRLCALNLEDLAGDLSDIVNADRQVLGRQVMFHVTLVGAAGPRCEANDAKCKPEPYEAAEYEPTSRRGAIEKTDGEPQCSWDGECKRSGCGNTCEVWTEAHRPGTCQDRPELKDALCGCVDGRCAWFVQ